MMKKYDKPTIIDVEIEIEDIIALSGVDLDDHDPDYEWD